MMKRKLKFCLTLICLFLPGVFIANSQVLVESVAAIVGNEVIYLSDIENTVADLRRNGTKTPDNELTCTVFQELLVSKLFMDQARIDSITVTEDAVEGDLNMRMNDAIRTAGSEEALVTYFKKSMLEIKRDIRKKLLESQVVSEVQSKIAKDIMITPAARKEVL
jgi:peptidyl-prolyl cis-trans isomerase SurA